MTDWGWGVWDINHPKVLEVFGSWVKAMDIFSFLKWHLNLRVNNKKIKQEIVNYQLRKGTEYKWKNQTKPKEK